jgi:anti-sigma B factor antagonist
MSKDGEPFRAELLRIEAKYDATAVTIVLTGEFDMTGIERFWAFFSEALRAHPGSMAVDARGLSFIDSSGLEALLRTRDATAQAGVTFRISDPSPELRRVAELGGVGDLLSDE